MFQLKRRPADAKKTKHKKIRAVSHEDLRYNKEERMPPQQLPFLVELNPGKSVEKYVKIRLGPSQSWAYKYLFNSVKLSFLILIV